MLDLVDKKDYEDGHVIFEEGTSEDQIYVVLSGSVEISKKANNKKHIIEMLEEGDVFGGASFLGVTEMQATATASGKTEVGIVKQASLVTKDEYRKAKSDIIDHFCNYIS